MRMAADSDGSLTAVVICEGNLNDPQFPRKFRHLLAKLKYILQQPKKSKKLKVNKVEPWNSVRVTLSIPKDAAAKLRQLASEGSSALRALGILSVQLEGDTVISLRLVGHDLVLRTDNTTMECVQEAGSSNATLGDLSEILGSRLQQTTAGPSSSPLAQSEAPAASASMLEPIAGPSHRNIMASPPVLPPGVVACGGRSSTPVANPVVLNGPTPNDFEKTPVFKSPNTVCPMDGKLPVPPLANIVETREYPFESMTQARVIQRKENTMAVVAALGGGVQTTIPVVNSTVGIGKGHQVTPPPLTIPVAGSPSDAAPQQPVQANSKSPFIQPPPPPYPSNAGGNHLKAVTHSAQPPHQQKQSSTIALSNNTNALSSPLLVNLLQNDGVNQVKGPTVGSSMVLQQQGPSSAIVSNLSSHTQNDGVLLLSSNSNDNSSGISISPSIPVPSSSQTISNIPSNAVADGAAAGVLNQNLLGVSNQSSSITGMAMRVQQQRFSVPQGAQSQQHILPQHQIIHSNAGGLQLQRFPTQQSQPSVGSVGPIAGATQQTFRHPHQQPQPQQPYAAPPPTPHPSLVNHQQQQQSTQVVANDFNHPRWPFKPMDSATKSSFQEFARYQREYNLQQEMNSQTSIVSASAGSRSIIDGSNNSVNSASEKSGVTDALGLSSYLDELSKTDLDSLLLPGLSDLDTALDLDGKNALESLLDAKDLDLDLIDQEGTSNVLPGPMITGSVNSQEQQPLQQAAPIAASLPQSSLLTQSTHSQVLPVSRSKYNVTPSKHNAAFNQGQTNLTSTGKERQYLINPLTGELEPMPSEDESDSEDTTNDNTDVFNAFNSEVSNSLFSDDENSGSTAFSKTSDHSDTERSSNSEASGRSRNSKSRKERKDTSVGAASFSSKKSKPSIKNNLLREKLQQGIKHKISGKSKQPKEKVLTKAKLISIDGKDSPSEKIKLRLKLEKSEPVSPAYKVDISFVPSPKRCQVAINSTNTSLPNHSSSSQSPISTTPNLSPNLNQQYQNALQASAPLHNASGQSPQTEEPRVPPLHISLRGKNSIVIKNSKKDRKKSQSGGEDDEPHLKKSQMKRNNIVFDEQTAINRYVVANDHGHLANNVNSKISCQGKPTSRDLSSDEYSACNSFSNSGLENGDDVDKTQLSNKRIAAEVVLNPNGAISPETKKRRMSQNHEQHQNILLSGEKHISEPYNHLHGPIGSTNVGTMPTHSSLSKNQKSSNNNNNSSNFISKLHKSSLKSVKPIVVVKHCKSPSNVPLKNPGKCPPVSTSLDHSQTTSTTAIATTLKAAVSLSIPSASSASSLKSTNSGVSVTTSKPLADPSVILKAVSLPRTVNKQTTTTCLLPQGGTDAISKEKFKQKLLEFQGVKEEKGVALASNSEGSSNHTCNSSNKNSVKIDKQALGSEERMANDKRVQDVVAQSSGTAAKSDLLTTNSSMVGSLKSSALVDSTAGDHSATKTEAKTKDAIQEQELRPPNQSHNAPPIDVGMNLSNSANGNGNVRNSPGSQAQGEDSGIESMDALSEKSPHQSASPQQGDTQPPHIPQKRDEDVVVHRKIEEKMPLDIKDEPEDEITNIRDIEAALAKMEGINEQFLTPCESPMHKLNGDHSMKEESLLANLTDDKIMLCATKLEHEEDLAAIMGGGNSGKSSPVLSPFCVPKMENCDLNENKEINAQMSLETQLIDECCKKSLKPNTKIENDTELSTRVSSPHNMTDKKFEENVIQIASSPKEVDIRLKMEADILSLEQPVKKEEIGNVEPSSSPRSCAASSSPLPSGVISDSNDKSVGDGKEILTPITIEIPTHSESEVPRVRTRASSKLESPLDAPKQSPQLDSPATVNSLKSNLRLSAAAIDRLSPKVVSTGKSAASGPFVAGSKRKRQGSESSTHSCVSDDAPGRSNNTSGPNSKRTRPNSLSSSTAHGSCENLNTASSKSSKEGGGSKKCNSGKVKKGPDESSDSDEPLIEVAGKVRGSKGHSSRTSMSECNDNKVLRNHRTTSQHSRTSSQSTASATSSNVSNGATGQSPATSKTFRGTNSSQSNSGTSTQGQVGVSASNNGNNGQQNNIHCTRASSSSTGTSSGGTGASATAFVSNTVISGSSHMQNLNHAPVGGQPQPHPHPPLDDKIGTRRSVRASAAANKIIYSRSGGPSNINVNSESSKTSTSCSAKGVNSSGGAENADSRRKTRSAAGGESTEGRRRRGSRDSK